MRKEKNKKRITLFLFCLFVSMSLHLFTLGFFYNYSFWFAPQWLKNRTSGLFSNKQVLSLSFKSLGKNPLIATSSVPTGEHVCLSLDVKLLKKEPRKVKFIKNSPKYKHELIGKNVDSYQHRPFNNSNVASELRKIIVHPHGVKEGLYSKNSSPSLENDNSKEEMLTLKPLPLTAAPTFVKKAVNSNLEFKGTAKNTEDEGAASPLKKPKVSLDRFSLPSLNELSTISCGENFSLDICYTPFEEGFLFAATLIPKKEKEFSKIKKNVLFILDCSSSIDKERFSHTRHSLLSALRFLNREDKFNIIAFNSSLSLFAEENQSLNTENVRDVRNFLRSLESGSVFSPTDFISPFGKILSSPDKKDELNIAILLSNGSELKKFHSQKFLYKWTQKNHGNLTLYTIASLNDKNLPILDFFSSLNKGKVIFSSTDRGIKRKLQRLMNDIKFPIAKNVHCTAINGENRKIELFQNGKLPNIYLDDPIVILGKTDSLKPFTLFFQGTHADRYFNIKKEVSLRTAREDSSLKEEWALHQANLQYKKYLDNGKASHLKAAQSILDTYELEAFFR